MRCLGLDLGTSVSGVALIEGQDLQHVRLVQESTRRSPSGTLVQRLAWMTETLEHLVQEQNPDVVALESVFYCKDVRALTALSQIRGAVLVMLQKMGISVIDCAPQAVKKAVTGQGNATKDQVARMLVHLLGVSQFSSADASDAAAVAYTGLLMHWHQQKLQEVR